VKRYKAFAAGLLVATLIGGPLAAQPTEITIRVISKGAKFVGTSMGGVRILLRDARSGELLAQGLTAGGTGDTALIMKQPRVPGATIATEDAARFTTTLELEAPRLIEVVAYGPLAQQQAAHTVSASQWVVPGRHVSAGDGWVLEMPGLVVDVLAPPTHVKLSGVPQSIELEANVTMMCGCPIEPGGLWDAGDFAVRALMRRDGEPFDQLPLAYAGSTSQFAGTWQVEQPGVSEATVYAYQATNGNTGLDRVTFIVSE